jgi:hypothetical protein
MTAFAIAKRLMLGNAYVYRVLRMADKAVAAALGVWRSDLQMAIDAFKQNLMIVVSTRLVV